MAVQGATKQNLSSCGTSETLVSWEEHLSPSSPSSVNLKMLAEKASTFDLKNINKNSGATKKGARKARLTDTPARDAAGKQPQQGFVVISKFFKSRDPIQGDDPTYCCASRLDVIDITLRSFRLLEGFKNWEVSSEPYLFEHRHTLFTL